MHHEQEQDLQQHEADFKPESGNELLHPASSEYILIAVCKQHNEQLAQQEQGRLVSVEICIIWIFKSNPYPITKHKADLQYHHIEYYEIDVLEPASQLFLMHNTLPASPQFNEAQ